MILQIGIHSLKDRKVVVIVVPERPPHQMFDPLAVNGAKLAVHFADDIYKQDAPLDKALVSLHKQS